MDQPQHKQWRNCSHGLWQLRRSIEQKTTYVRRQWRAQKTATFLFRMPTYGNHQVIKKVITDQNLIVNDRFQRLSHRLWPQVPLCDCSEGGAGASWSCDDGGLRHRSQHSGAEVSPRLRTQSSCGSATDLSGWYCMSVPLLTVCPSRSCERLISHALRWLG